MKKLEDIKNDLAIKYGFDSYLQLLKTKGISDGFLNEVVNLMLQELNGKIERKRVRVDTAYIVESSINIGLDMAKDEIDSLYKNK